MLIKSLILKYKEFIKFGIVGASGTIIDFGLLNLLVFFQINVYLAATISFLAAASNNFYFNKTWTFRFKGKKALRQQYLQFLLVSVIGLLINVSIMYVLIEYFNFWYNYAKFAAILVVLWWNGRRYIIILAIEGW